MSDHFKRNDTPITICATLTIPNTGYIVKSIKNCVVSIYEKYFNLDTAKIIIAYYTYITFVSYLIVSFSHATLCGLEWNTYGPRSSIYIPKFQRIRVKYFYEHMMVACGWPCGILSHLMETLTSIIMWK